MTGMLRNYKEQMVYNSWTDGHDVHDFE